jgi:hypothetical protein
MQGAKREGKVPVITGRAIMQTVTLSEFCRIVKKKVFQIERTKEKSSLVRIGEDHGRWEESGKHHRRISRYMGSGMYEKNSSELERPYLPSVPTYGKDK